MLLFKMLLSQTPTWCILKKKVIKNAPLLNVIRLDTQVVHLTEKVVKNTLLLNIIKSATHGVHLLEEGRQ